MRKLIVFAAAFMCPYSPALAQVAVVPASVGAELGCFGKFEAALLAKKACLCASPLGQLLNNATKPVSCLTGGIIPTCCSCTPGPAGGPAGAAAAIAADAAEAKARRAAVRFLATVDCHYYPEAEAMLIAALRADRNECVRWEAAHSLNAGCCCTKNTIAALTICVTGSEKDGNPSETSIGVRTEAYMALQDCLSRNGGPKPVPPEFPNKPEQPLGPPPLSAVEGLDANVELTAYYQQTVPKTSFEQLLSDARKASLAANTHLVPLAGHRTGQRNLISMWRNSASTSTVPTPAPELSARTPRTVPSPAVIAAAPRSLPATAPIPNVEATIYQPLASEPAIERLPSIPPPQLNPAAEFARAPEESAAASSQREPPTPGARGLRR